VSAAVIRAALARNPARSNVAVVADVGGSMTTVIRVRRDLERAREIHVYCAPSGRSNGRPAAHALCWCQVPPLPWTHGEEWLHEFNAQPLPLQAWHEAAARASLPADAEQLHLLRAACQAWAGPSVSLPWHRVTPQAGTAQREWVTDPGSGKRL
jgi:hypothetical protein